MPFHPFSPNLDNILKLHWLDNRVMLWKKYFNGKNT